MNILINIASGLNTKVNTPFLSAYEIAVKTRPSSSIPKSRKTLIVKYQARVQLSRKFTTLICTFIPLTCTSTLLRYFFTLFHTYHCFDLTQPLLVTPIHVKKPKYYLFVLKSLFVSIKLIPVRSSCKDIILLIYNILINYCYQLINFMSPPF